MGFFEGWAGKYFARDAAGRPVYYPWGFAGKGYVIPDDARETHLRRALRREQQATLVLILGSMLFGHWLPVACVLAGLYLASYFINRRLVRGLAVSGERLSIAASLRGQAAATGVRTLWAFLVVSVLVCAAAIVIPSLKRARTIEDIVIAVVTALFFGAAAAISVYMIRVKR